VFISQICQFAVALFLAANSTFELSKEMRGSAALKKLGVRLVGLELPFSRRTILLPEGNLADNSPPFTEGACTKRISG
jgi:hypothetical protein